LFSNRSEKYLISKNKLFNYVLDRNNKKDNNTTFIDNDTLLNDRSVDINYNSE